MVRVAEGGYYEPDDTTLFYGRFINVSNPFLDESSISSVDPVLYYGKEFTDSETFKQRKAVPLSEARKRA